MKNVNSETKICNKCKLEKPVAEFSRDGPYLRYRCKKCESEYHKHVGYKSYQRYYVGLWLKNIKESLCCCCCGYKGSKCYKNIEFHHIVKSIKSFGISQAKNKHPIDIITEIKTKCIPLCSNCHSEIEMRVTAFPKFNSEEFYSKIDFKLNEILSKIKK